MRRAVAKVEIPYVQVFKDRHGKPRHYYRRKGFARVAIPGVPGSSEFMAVYASCGTPSAPVEPRSRLQPRSINALIVEYYRSAEWANLKASTRPGYRCSLERFRESHGSKGVASILPKHLEAIFHGMANRSGAAKNLRKRLRRVFQLAVRLGWRNDNPVQATEAPRRKVKGFTPWGEASIQAYEARWPSGSRERLALALLLYTGQRKSDVITMGRQHVKAARIRVCQLKTDVRLSIRIHPALQAELDAAPVGMTFLLTSFGKPFTSGGFGNWFRERATMAGLDGLTAHGLRKAAGRRLAEAGCTAKEIMAVLGHTTMQQVELYTRDADQETLADAAMHKLENNA